MSKFYFVLSGKNSSYQGGWSEVTAPDLHVATAGFRAYHPDRVPGITDCASIYGQEEFEKTEMYTNGNLGKRCVEKISITRNIPKE